jgi:hypothetical protein
VSEPGQAISLSGQGIGTGVDYLSLVAAGEGARMAMAAAAENPVSKGQRF